MRTNHRLMEAYKNARVESIDQNSKYIFFSDCHRGDGSPSDEFTKNQIIYLYALEYYYKNGFVYVEAGDGDELWEHKRFKDIKIAHHDVFEAFKKFNSENRLIMLYGNHNIYLKDENYVKKNLHEFYDDYKASCDEFLKGIQPCGALLLKNQETGLEFLTVHGHQGDFTNDQLWFFTMLSVKYFWRFMHSFGLKNPASPVKNAYKRHKIEKNYVQWIKRHRTALICGHTHRFKFPRPHELPYFNIGSCIYPSSITGIEISDGMIQSVRWRTRCNDEGILQVTKRVIRGPEPLEKFNIR
ncbi:MAG TPA: serine/threonine protein phosphatase [Peptococcaceae bacterium]|nr:serine/threonine protein phosphatase [Peptococcaceae bacterium]